VLRRYREESNAAEKHDRFDCAGHGRDWRAGCRTTAVRSNKYPALAGQWQRVGPLGVFDSTKPPARGQQAPLTPEYQAIFEANLAEVAKGGFGDDPVYTCIPEGMPRAMNLVLPMEIVITPNTTYILMEYLSMLRRIYTDGRSFRPTRIPHGWDTRSASGSMRMAAAATACSRSRPAISRTRAPSIPAACCCTGMARPSSRSGSISTRPTGHPARRDHRSGHALTAPLDGREEHEARAQTDLVESICGEGNVHVNIANQHYMLNGDGELMPSKKDQPAPT